MRSILGVCDFVLVVFEMPCALTLSCSLRAKFVESVHLMIGFGKNYFFVVLVVDSVYVYFGVVSVLRLRKYGYCR